MTSKGLKTRDKIDPKYKWNIEAMISDESRIDPDLQKIRKQAEKFAVTPDSFLKPEHVPGIKGKELPLSWDLFAQGTWIFDSLKSDTIAIRSRKSKKSIRIHFPDFPFLALWSPEKGGAPFICIEPWFGHADMEGYTGDFRRRHGTQELAPGKEFNAGYSFTVGS